MQNIYKLKYLKFYWFISGEEIATFRRRAAAAAAATVNVFYFPLFQFTSLIQVLLLVRLTSELIGFIA